MESKKNREGGVKVSREYKGFGQGGWAIRKVGNIETGTDKTQYNIIQYK